MSITFVKELGVKKGKRKEGKKYKLKNKNIIVKLNIIFQVQYINCYCITTTVTQLVRAFALDVEGWVFESKPRQT